MRMILGLFIVALAAAAAFQTFGGAELVDGGSQAVIRHAVPADGVWIALGIAVVALVWLGSGIHGHTAAGLVGVMVLLMAAHEIAEDPGSGVVEERIAMVPLRSLPLAKDGPAPTYRVSMLAVQVETGAGAFTTIRGVPPVAIELAAAPDAGAASGATFSDR